MTYRRYFQNVPSAVIMDGTDLAQQDSARVVGIKTDQIGMVVFIIGQ